MPSNIKDTLIKLLVMSFIIGILLSFFNIDPSELLKNLGGTVQKIFAALSGIVEWGIKYVLLGAVVVVPIWLIFFVIGKARGRKN